MKTIVLVVLVVTASLRGNAQHAIGGMVKDVDTQLVINEFIEIYTDTTGVPFPYYDTTRTDHLGRFNFTLPTTIPVGVNFKVRVYNCGNPLINIHLYPYNTTTSNFTVCATNKYIKGNVLKGSTPADLAMVYLIRRTLDSFTLNYNFQVIDSTTVDSGSAYYVFKLPISTGIDSYMVKGELLPADSTYILYVPAYYNGELKWSTATVLPNQNITAPISLPLIYSMQGPGYITGTVVNQAGDSLYKRILVLTTANDVPVGYRYSNTMGAFSFGGLDYGTYKLYGDALGKWNPPMIFTLSATSPSLTDIIFTEDSTSFIGMLWPLSLNETPSAETVTVYPNPVADYLHIKGLENTGGEKSVTLYSIDGRVVYSKTFTGNAEIVISVAELPTGLYLLQLDTIAGSRRYKIAR